MNLSPSRDPEMADASIDKGAREMLNENLARDNDA